MGARLHDDEPDTSETIARALLAAECPRWKNAPLSNLRTSGTDNTMWRAHLDDQPDVVLRLPRRPGAAAGVEQEMAVLEQLEAVSLGPAVATPRVRHVGHAQEMFPHRWSVLEWIEGTDAWSARERLSKPFAGSLAQDLARAVRVIGTLPADALRSRPSGDRGGPLRPLLDRLDGWLTDPRLHAADLLDVALIKRLADEARELADEPVPLGFVHGDLIPGNLLLDGQGLAAIIDWGGAGLGDMAQDLAPAWAVLSPSEQPIFREMLGVDEAAWIRGRAFELEHAVGSILYYVPRRHPLGDVMQRTLGRILADYKRR